MELSWNPEVPGHISSLVPYPPGKPIEETEREFGITGVVKLASNENPLGPSPKAMAAIRDALPNLHLYPDGSHFVLKKTLAERLGCSSDELCIGNGSNEFIDILPRVFVSKGRNLVTHKAAFVIYKLCAQLQGVECLEAPIDDNLEVTVDALLGAMNGDTRLVVLANPNNPTGNFLAAAEVDRLATELARRHILLVLDYAYWEYVTDKSIPDPMVVYRKHANVIVLRTFSKVYGLAGTRVGYLIADKKITAMVERARQPFNVSSLALVAAVAALGDHEHLERSVKLNISSKAELEKRLARYPVRVFPSQGNFLLVDMKRALRFCRKEGWVYHVARADLEVQTYNLLCVVALPEAVMALRDAKVKEMISRLPSNTIVTDVFSSKSRGTLELARLCAAHGLRFGWSHPLAGREGSGAASADPAIFSGALVLVDSGAPTTVRSELTRFWQALDCKVELLSTAVHQKRMAMGSHLMHVLAYSLMHVLEKDGEGCGKSASPSVLGITRVAKSNPDAWASILFSNRKEVLSAVTCLIQGLRKTSALLKAGDTQALTKYLAEAQRLRLQLESGELK
ncbi:MAG: histidinol-phosphate transaminase [Deltaproteobacteria bacterium]|nr:histidinol-phosphate transaminase [Deltaproteobacteria bacterium]